jgi:lysophospholipase L1-like esterase
VNETHLQKGDLAKGFPAVSRLQSVTVQYASVVKEIAADFKDKNVVLLDLHSALMQEAVRLTPQHVQEGRILGSLEDGDSIGLRQLLVDGLHLTGLGYKVFFNIIQPHVGKEWVNEPLENPSWVFP